MKNLLVLGLAAVFMFSSCGSGNGGGNGDSTGGDAADHSELFNMLKISNDGIPYGAMLGMKVEDIKKNHTEKPDEDSDNTLVTYTKAIGPDEFYDELSVYYYFDSESGELWSMDVDVSSSKLSDGPDLYKELVAYFEGKFGKGSTEADDDWENMHYVTNLNNKKTEITVRYDKTATDYAWLKVEVEEMY